MKYEDFYPTDDTKALIVCGSHYTKLTEIREVEYSLHEDGSIEFVLGKLIQKGKNLRLGNYYNNELFFSDQYMPPIKIQPYMTDLGLLYQTKGKIYLDNYILIEPSEDYVVLGRPTYHDGYVYYETRKDPFVQKGWEVWRFNMETKEKAQLLENAANPYCYNDKLFYSHWISEFHTKWLPLKDLKESRILRGLKSRLTKKTYPPNMHYNVRTLEPIGRLKKRKNIIQKNFGTFFTTQKDLRFLDMGCSKGYFSLLGSGMFAEVVSFDNDEEVIQLCKDISDARGANNIKFMSCSHGEFLDSYDGEMFDRVMLGNGPHYPFLERGGHGYIAEIAALMNSGGELLLEGPLGMEGVDMKIIIPQQLRSIFNKADFMKEMNQFFSQVDSFARAINEDRYVSLWKRK